MSKHSRRDDNETDIIAEIVPLPDEPPEDDMVLLSDWLKDHPNFSYRSGEFAPMFRGMDPNPTEPVEDGPEPTPLTEEIQVETVLRPRMALLIVTLIAVIISLVALSMAMWVGFRGCDCSHTPTVLHPVAPR